jgi:lycopene cyclase CruP
MSKSLTEQILTQIPGNPWENLQKLDRLWADVKEDRAPIPEVISYNYENLDKIDYDILICGGTLGILLGATLAQKGWKIAVIERGILRGRDQEWNISRRELDVFLELNLLDKEEIENAIASEYNPARISFPETPDIWVKDVLNIGINPVYLLEKLKNRFLEAGGYLLEKTDFINATIHPNGVNVALKNSENFTLNTRLLLDGMGHFSPIAKQARKGKKPDAVCLVVGTCATGYENNTTGDIFASFTPSQNQCQYFWEAFPAKDGRTTYLFTYLDAHPNRFSLQFLFDEYLRLLPEYQKIELKQLTFKRALFGFFPCYRESPLKTPWERILPIGDSSGNQSPLSFGGFGAMLRHLSRLNAGINNALKQDILDKESLQLLQPYQPSLSVTWMFQKSMSLGIDQKINPDQINELLAGIFQVMEKLGEPVLKPFLQDVVQYSSLTKTLMKSSIALPLTVIKILPQIGIKNLLEWLIHYSNLGIYTGLYPTMKNLQPLTKNLSPITQYYYQCWLDKLQYGSGNDYHSS